MITRLLPALLTLGLAPAIASTAFAQGPPAGTHPCQQIEQFCKAAGFIQGDFKNGDGLWRDCVDPIMHGTTTVSGGKKALPTVDPALVSACKAKNPKFGSGKVGS